MLPTAGNFIDPAGNGTATRDGNITWDWIKRELDRGQDVEVMTATHWVVLEGYLTWGDVHLVVYRDDPFQNGAATTVDEKNIIAKRHKTTYIKDQGGGTVRSNIGNGDETVLTVFSESPAAVGGIASLLDRHNATADNRASAGREEGTPIAAAAVAVGVITLTVGAWYARRRWVRH